MCWSTAAARIAIAARFLLPSDSGREPAAQNSHGCKSGPAEDRKLVHYGSNCPRLRFLKNRGNRTQRPHCASTHLSDPASLTATFEKKSLLICRRRPGKAREFSRQNVASTKDAKCGRARLHHTGGDLTRRRSLRSTKRLQMLGEEGKGDQPIPKSVGDHPGHKTSPPERYRRQQGSYQQNWR